MWLISLTHQIYLSKCKDSVTSAGVEQIPGGVCISDESATIYGLYLNKESIFHPLCSSVLCLYHSDLLYRAHQIEQNGPCSPYVFVKDLNFIFAGRVDLVHLG